MIVVSDTTPLNYLLLINAINVLPQLFREVYVPQQVLNRSSPVQNDVTPYEAVG
jgi:predicted nucleic acid-binding protein